jgi:class 3 adenylate cyclase
MDPFHAQHPHRRVEDEDGRRRHLALMFTDIVSSTSLLLSVGDEEWLRVLRWHDTVVRACLARRGGREVKQVGDGFFAVFENAANAVVCALEIQQSLAESRARGSARVHVRIGIHRADVLEAEGDYVGRGVHEAARITELAGADEILASTNTVGSTHPAVSGSASREVTLRGMPETVELVMVNPSPTPGAAHCAATRP